MDAFGTNMIMEDLCGLPQMWNTGIIKLVVILCVMLKYRITYWSWMACCDNMGVPIKEKSWKTKSDNIIWQNHKEYLVCGAIRYQSADGHFKITHVWANDYDEDTCKTYTKNIWPDEPETVHCGDIYELDIDSLGEIDAFR